MKLFFNFFSLHGSNRLAHGHKLYEANRKKLGRQSHSPFHHHQRFLDWNKRRRSPLFFSSKDGFSITATGLLLV